MPESCFDPIEPILVEVFCSDWHAGCGEFHHGLIGRVELGPGGAAGGIGIAGFGELRPVPVRRGCDGLAFVVERRATRGVELGKFCAVRQSE
jgi:hypothetical protein